MYYVFKKVSSVKNETSYKKYRNKLNHILQKAEKQYYHDLLNKHKDNLSKSCRIVKNIIHKNKKSSCQSKFQLPDGNFTSDKKIILEKFNDFLSMLVQLWLKKSLLLTNLHYHICILELMNPYFCLLLLQLR